MTRLAALALPAVALAIGGLERRWVGDDGFINVRVAQQLLAGNGLVFNAGERVEAITSPGWVLLLSIEHFARMPFHGKARELGERLARRCEGTTSGA